jgi:uncharacterized protein
LIVRTKERIFIKTKEPYYSSLKSIKRSQLKMPDNEYSQVLQEIKKKALELIGGRLAEAILYGSYARSKQDDDSDLDVMLLVNDEEENIKKWDKIFTDIGFELSMKYNVMPSIFVNSRERFYKYLDVLPFYMNVDREGVRF